MKVSELFELIEQYKQKVPDIMDYTVYIAIPYKDPEHDLTSMATQIRAMGIDKEEKDLVFRTPSYAEISSKVLDESLQSVMARLPYLEKFEGPKK